MSPDLGALIIIFGGCKKRPHDSGSGPWRQESPPCGSRQKTNSSEAGTVLPPTWPSHTWLMTWHFLGIPAGFGQSKLPEPVGNCWQSTLAKAADGGARAHPHNVRLVPGHPLLKAPCVALTPVSSLSWSVSLTRVSLSLPIRRVDPYECGSERTWIVCE